MNRAACYVQRLDKMSVCVKRGPNFSEDDYDLVHVHTCYETSVTYTTQQ